MSHQPPRNVCICFQSGRIQNIDDATFDPKSYAERSKEELVHEIISLKLKWQRLQQNNGRNATANPVAKKAREDAALNAKKETDKLKIEAAKIAEGLRQQVGLWIPGSYYKGEEWRKTFKNEFVFLTQFVHPGRRGKFWKDDLEVAAENTIEKHCPNWENDECEREVYDKITEEKEKSKNKSPRQGWLWEKAHWWLLHWLSCSEHKSASWYPHQAIRVAFALFLSDCGKIESFVRYLKRRNTPGIGALVKGHDSIGAAPPGWCPTCSPWCGLAICVPTTWMSHMISAEDPTSNEEPTSSSTEALSSPFTEALNSPSGEPLDSPPIASLVLPPPDASATAIPPLFDLPTSPSINPFTFPTAADDRLSVQISNGSRIYGGNMTRGPWREWGVCLRKWELICYWYWCLSA